MKQQHRLAYRAISEVSQGKHGAITKLLSYVGVSRQAYNKFLHRQETVWGAQEKLLEERITYWFKQHHQAIGAGKILSNLNRDEQITFDVTIKRVKRIMGNLGIRCQIRVKKHHRIKEQEQYMQDNLLNQNFTATAPNQVWLSDSTELSYGVNGQFKMRLSGVLDLYGRVLIASNLSKTETADAEIEVFRRAFEYAGDVNPVVHTDRGSAYTSKQFNNFLVPYEVTRSMSRPGTPCDNAPMERWWNEFKTHWMDRHPMPKTYEEFEALVKEGIHYFNHLDRSPARNDLTPVEYRSEAA
ncbi:IS3 family transposase [Levilactobacillus yonginensis]|uniref:IS3 family transposase n=1 Tax=Levilactobacillus yonginensis TaxID=1054041 RepID=UPI00345CD5DB